MREGLGGPGFPTSVGLSTDDITEIQAAAAERGKLETELIARQTEAAAVGPKAPEADESVDKKLR